MVFVAVAPSFRCSDEVLLSILTTLVSLMLASLCTIIMPSLMLVRLADDPFSSINLAPSPFTIVTLAVASS
ncbi:Uncharacterised protein [Yersinia rohdei]|uniref:Uncharacterized protein n=1 Tax=Yersinia rohdei TaxID=29485 RepID=A0A0U1HYC7_YERRO|nr:Uncharacterised protein [Yersinia rohdei]